MSKYIRLTKGLNDRGVLIKPEQLYDYVDDADKDWYSSVYYYNEEQLKSFKEKGTIAGITDVKTDKLVFDLDSVDDINEARNDAVEVIKRLNKMGIKETAVEIYFSGNKGFTIQLKLDREISPSLARKIALNKVGESLKTLDTTVYNASRILRIPGTRHQVSKLYKIPLSFKELSETTVEQIKTKAKSLDNIPEEIQFEPQEHIPEDFFVIKETKITKPLESIIKSDELDFKNKPKFLTNCRWALQNGFFKEGQRSTALLCLASTYKNLGFDVDHVYRLLKGVAEMQAKRNDSDRFPDEELYNNVVMQIFNDTWNNGQYTCRKDGWLKGYCETLGHNKCKHDEDKVFSDFDAITNNFKDFATNLEYNIVRLGIPGLDDKVTLTTSMLVGLLGAPSSGKTQTSLAVLNNASKNGIESAFFSMDMGAPLVITRLIQKHTGFSQSKIYDFYKKNKESELNDVLKENYKNVNFCFKGGLTVEQIRQSVIDHRNNTGRPFKLIVIDYLECIAGPFSDQNANVALVARQLKDLANEEQLLVVLLLQTQKHSGDPSSPLLTMRNVKGASTIEQDCSVIISLYREGFSPTTPENDRFISFSVIKNRMGSLSSTDCGFDGLTGKITYPLSEEEYMNLKELREMKKRQKESEDTGWN